MATRKRLKSVNEDSKGNKLVRSRASINTEGLDKDQRKSVANTRWADMKAKMKKKYDKREVTVGNKSKLQKSAQTASGVKGGKAQNQADLYRSANKAEMELKNSEKLKARDRAAKKKKEAAESKTPINYGTPMSYSMKPGSREKDSPGAFRDTPINKYMGSPVNYGTESPMNDGHDKKRKLGTEGMSSDEKVAYYKKQSENMKKKKSSSNKAPRGPQNISIGGVKARASVKGRSEKNTDLLDVAKKGIKKIFG